jgi:hypothetical protein
MSATATRIATLGRFVRQALSPHVPREGLRAAEDRGFEPRRVVTPNRISSVLPGLSPVRDHIRDRTKPQARHAGNSCIVRNETTIAANARRVRARIVRAAGQASTHLTPPSAAAEIGPTMRSIVVLAMPVSR